ncbi:hypothetical protein [Mycetohabitans rhizoxinica]
MPFSITGNQREIGNRATDFPSNKPLHYTPFNSRIDIPKNEIRVPVALQ